MNKKQKRTRNRIVAALAIFAAVFAVTEFVPLAQYVGGETNALYLEFVLFLIPYLIAGYDVLLKAARNIGNGQVFDENFLMTIATVGAFALVLFPDSQPHMAEGAAVMLFYQVGELFQGYASVIDAKVPPSFSYANKDVYSYDYDVEKAKSLCAEAGYDMSTPLKLACYYTDQQSIDVCESMVYYLNEAGFNVELVFITGDLVSGIYDTKDYNIVYAGLSAMGPEEAYSSLSGKFIKVGKESFR